jgi:hypothetical protein
MIRLSGFLLVQASFGIASNLYAIVTTSARMVPLLSPYHMLSVGRDCYVLCSMYMYKQSSSLPYLNGHLLRSTDTDRGKV